jgi:protein-tyrosine-phosphatase
LPEYQTQVQFAVAGSIDRGNYLSLWKRHSTVPAASAGTQPAPRAHPRAVGTALKHGLSLAPARTSPIDETLRPDDLVVAVCDNAHEQFGPRVPDRLHWSVPDPTRTVTDDAFAEALSESPTGSTGWRPPSALQEAAMTERAV